ncbi:MAG TPA: Flp pilus assembly protein CpaB [Bryobacteraceae bacterium]|jgi:pilus assembly protein CpaB|nr:Flp pilus assembly protein CpaB [Bryobacteraceae bacterium]
MDRKKVLMIFAAAWVSAALLTWFLYASTKAPHVEKTAALVAAARDMPAGTRLRKADLKTIHVPERDVPKMAMVDEKQALDRPLLFPITANEPITLSKVASVAGAEGLPATIEIGKRAIAVPITDASGVAGLIQPRAHVDVLFTRPGTMAEAITTTILEDVVVLAIGRNTEGTNSSTPATATAQAAARPSAQSATLLVSPEQARKLELAKNQGKISLALRNPLDHTGASDNSSTTSQALFSELSRGKTPDVRNNKLWNQMLGTKEEKPPVVVEKAQKADPPPRPRVVIDVFHGEKHVQESFQ